MRRVRGTRGRTSVSGRKSGRIRNARRALLVVCALLLAQLGSLIAPAYACGCGAMVPARQATMGAVFLALILLVVGAAVFRVRRRTV